MMTESEKVSRNLNKKNKNDEFDLSDEDLHLKHQLETYVENVGDSDPKTQKAGIDGLREQIRAATSSITSVPKPLKFLRPHYGTLQNHYENMASYAGLKKLLADILSVLAMSHENQRATLKYRLLGSDADIGYWGHEYVRKLAGEILQEYAEEQSEDDPDYDLIDGLMVLVQKIIAFYMKHNAEYEAVDLSMEVECLATVIKHVVKENYKKTCLYLTSLVKYLKSDMPILKIVLSIYMHFDEYCRALQIALRLGSIQYARMVYMSCKDLPEGQQVCFNIARHGMIFILDYEDFESVDAWVKIQGIIDNTRLNKGYLMLARDCEVMEPKSPEDIYKAHLTKGRGSGSGPVNSAWQNLAATYVNGFVNAGFCQDMLMTVPSDASFHGGSSTSWLFKNKEHGKISAAASLGMVFLWDVDSGLAQLDKYLHSTDTHVIAGALIGVGIVHCNVQDSSEAALPILLNFVNNEDSLIKVGAIMGLGLAYAGTQNENVLIKLVRLLKEGKVPLDVIAFAALSLGLVYVGSCNEQATQAIVKALMDRSESELGDPLARFMPLGLGLLYLGKEESVEPTAKVLKTFNIKIRKYCDMILLSCAYAGTGDVLLVQHFLGQCAQHLGKGGSYQGTAVLGIAMVAMAEEIGLEMAIRSLEHLLQYGEQNIRRAVPLALGLLCISNPKVNVMNTLSRLSHDADTEVAWAAIISLGLIGAGTNNARIAGMLRNLASYSYKNDSLFCVRIAQGLVHMGKGLMTLSPYHSERFLLSRTALAGIVTMLHSCLDMKAIILGKYHYVLYFLGLAMQPRMLMTLDEDLKPISVPVRVGQAVDIVGCAGNPKTITGSQTLSTPVILSAGDRAELATEKYIPLSPFLEGFVILKLNPDYSEDF